MTADNDAISLMCLKHIEIATFLVLRIFGIAKNHLVSTLMEFLFDVECHSREKGLDDIWYDKTDQIGVTRIQSTGDLVRLVVQQVDGLLDCVPCFLRDIASVVEIAGDRVFRHPCHSGHICYRCQFEAPLSRIRETRSILMELFLIQSRTEWHYGRFFEYGEGTERVVNVKDSAGCSGMRRSGTSRTAEPMRRWRGLA